MFLTLGLRISYLVDNAGRHPKWSQKDPARRSQNEEQPRAARSSQEQPGAARSSQEHPGDTQEHSGDTQQHPGDTQKHSEEKPSVEALVLFLSDLIHFHKEFKQKSSVELLVSFLQFYTAWSLPS